MDACFVPAIWPEDKQPNEADRYRQCALCAQGSRVIWGEGNPKAPVFVVLDNPGAREDKEGNEYVCATREALQEALHQANLSANDVYVTYLLKCRPLRRYDKEEAKAFSKPFLIRQIERARPKFIVCLGDVVAQAMFDDQDAHVKNLRGSWHAVLGYPCMVSYHPLAVRRRPNLMGKFREDWIMLSQRLSCQEEGITTDRGQKTENRYAQKRNEKHAPTGPVARFPDRRAGILEQADACGRCEHESDTREKGI